MMPSQNPRRLGGAALGGRTTQGFSTGSGDDTSPEPEEAGASFPDCGEASGDCQRSATEMTAVDWPADSVDAMAAVSPSLLSLRGEPHSAQ